MNKTLKKIGLFASILILLLFILFVINQTAQVVQLAEKVTPSFGKSCILDPLISLCRSHFNSNIFVFAFT